MHDTEALREHYHLALFKWLDQLWKNRKQAEQIVGQEVVRLWLLYFALFAVGFDRGVVSLYQTLSSKSRIGGSGLPPTRGYMYKFD